jgi:hypothetical protein
MEKIAREPARPYSPLQERFPGVLGLPLRGSLLSTGLKTVLLGAWANRSPTLAHVRLVDIAYRSFFPVRQKSMSPLQITVKKALSQAGTPTRGESGSSDRGRSDWHL